MDFRIMRFVAWIVVAICVFPVLGGFVPGIAPAAMAAEGKTVLLAVGVCPPYRKNIPVKVCRNWVKSIVKEFSHAFGIDKADIIALTDEESSGQNVLKVLDELSKTLTADDRLVFYLRAGFKSS
jgi:hypothetical protein